MSVRTAQLPLVVLLVVLLAAAAAGDVIHLKNGGRVEGEVVAEEATRVTIETRFGKQVIDRARIARIEYGETPATELRRRERELAADDVDGWWELARFAEEHKLRRDHRRLLEKVVALAADHEGANQALGRVRHQGRWMTPEEREAAIQAQREADLRARGLVPWQGRWVTPEERDKLEQGLVLHDGNWMSEEEAWKARGFVRLEDGWVEASEEEWRRRAERFENEVSVPLTVASSRHVLVATALEQEFSTELAGHGQRAFERCADRLGEARDLEWLGGQKPFALVVDEREHFQAFARFFSRHEEKVNDRWARSVARADGFYWWDPTGTSATWKGSARDRGLVASQTIHNLGHVFLNRHGYNFKFLPVWLDEGFASLLEREILGSHRVTCLNTRRYGGTGVRQERLLPGSEWFGEIVDRIRERRDPPLDGIIRKDFTTIEMAEIAKSMAIVHYLATQRLADFRRFVDALRVEWPEGIVNPRVQAARQAHEKAFAALGTPLPVFEKELRDYYLNAGVPPAGSGQDGS